MQKELWGRLDKKEMTVMDAIMTLDDLIDASDPDVCNFIFQIVFLFPAFSSSSLAHLLLLSR